MVEVFPRCELTSDDDPGFTRHVDRIIAGLVFRYRPAVVCTVRVRRWFDHRWLGYSGKGRVAFDSPFLSDPGVSLDALYQKQLTFPPFAPTRVAAETHWQRGATGNYAIGVGNFVIHRPERRHSSAYLQRRIADFASSALYVWFSTSAHNAARSSVMVYSVLDNAITPWFAAFVRSSDGAAQGQGRDSNDYDGTSPNGWKLAEVKGLGRTEVVELLQHPPGVAT